MACSRPPGNQRGTVGLLWHGESSTLVFRIRFVYLLKLNHISERQLSQRILERGIIPQSRGRIRRLSSLNQSLQIDHRAGQSRSQRITTNRDY